MSLQDAWQLNFDFFRGRTICVEPVEEALSTDAGLLVLRNLYELVTGRIAAGDLVQVQESEDMPGKAPR